MTPTVQSLATDIYEEWVDDGADAEPGEYVDARSADAVPAITTVLFQMVVENNALAFVDSPIEGAEPFGVLANAVRSEVERVALDAIRAHQASEEES